MKFKNDVEIQNSDLTISNTGAAHLILNGDSNNSGDAGQEDAIIDFLADGGTYGYRLNSENYSQKSAFNIQENRNGTYTSRLYIDKDGDVGIGTDTPTAPLHIFSIASGTSYTNSQINIEWSSVYKLGISHRGYFFGEGNNDFRFNRGGSTQLNIHGTAGVANFGYVGIGTTNAKALLHLRKDTATAGSESIVLLDNRQTGTDSYYSGGLWGAGFRDVADPGYLAGIDFLRTSQSGGLSSQGEMIFYTTTVASTLSSIRASNERMRIDSIGNVGIGTDSPGEKLTINGNDNYVAVEHTNYKWGASNVIGGKLGVINANGAAILDMRRWTGTGSNHGTAAITQTNINGGWGLDFKVGAKTTNTVSTVSRMFIDQNGKVGIGTDNPPHELTIQGSNNPNLELRNTNYSNGGFVLNRSNYGQQWKWWAQSSLMYFGYSTDETNYTNHLAINANGNIGIGSTNPQSRLQVSSGSTAETTLIVGASGTTSNVSSRIFLNEGELGVTNSKDYGFSLAYDGTGGSYGLPANVFAIMRHDNNAAGNHALAIRRDNGNVGIGTDSPSEKLQVVGNTLINSIFFNTGYGQQFISTGNGTTINFGQPTSYVQNMSVQGRIQASSSVMVGNNTITASAADVGGIRYRVSGNNSYMDMCMQTGSNSYAWVNVVQNQW